LAILFRVVTGQGNQENPGNVAGIKNMLGKSWKSQGNSFLLQGKMKTKMQPH